MPAVPHNLSVAVTDWNSEGDIDRLFHDYTSRPLEGGRLMLAENVGTSQKPVFLMPVPILRINASSQVVDWNGDGRMALITGVQRFPLRLQGAAERQPLRPCPHFWPKRQT